MKRAWAVCVAALVVGCGAPETGGTGGGSATGGGSSIGGGSAIGGGLATGGGSATGGGTATGGGSANCGTDTWANLGNAFFVNNCSPCHGSFSHASVAANTATYASVIGSGSMPRGISVDPAVRQQIVAWLNCGAP